MRHKVQAQVLTTEGQLWVAGNSEAIGGWYPVLPIVSDVAPCHSAHVRACKK